MITVSAGDNKAFVAVGDFVSAENVVFFVMLAFIDVAFFPAAFPLSWLRNMYANSSKRMLAAVATSLILRKLSSCRAFD